MSQDQALQLFRPYLPTWLRERIGARDLQPGAVTTCNATILYADLSGFTQLTAAYASLPGGAERLHDALNRCYTALIETIGAFGGDVPAIAGDALTAWWPRRTDLDLARRCGSAMLAAMATLPPLITPEGQFQLDLRIGVSVGQVYAILAGLPSHGVHLVIAGPALEAAAAAERTAAPGAVQVAPAVPFATRDLIALPAGEAGAPLSWEHFLPPTFADRLRLNELIAEYRRCVPVFATFAMPGRPEELQALVAQVQAVVMRWGGWLNEIEVGDKGALFVLLFGAPVARGDDASRAIGCCLELRERGLISRAGITLGILFVGAVGGPQRRVYTAQGDDMNLAAHLMQLAAPGEILVSGRVRHDVMDRYATTEPEIVQTKGHAEGVPISRVRSGAPGERASTPALRRYLPDAATMVGHERERAAIDAIAAAARAGRPALLLVEGESGIGKSCLLQDLFLRWTGSGAAGYSAECSSGGLAAPLLAWRPVLLDLCGVDEGAPPRQQLAELDRALAPFGGAEAAGRNLLAVALMIGGHRPEAAAPLTVADEGLLIDLVVGLVGRQAHRGPLLIVIEDVHWADNSSLRLAGALLDRAQQSGAQPLLIVLSHRPLDGPPPAPLAELHAHLATTRVLVGRLSSNEITAMIRAQLGVADVQDALRQHVERHTEGQPLFIKEYLRVLRQHDLIRLENGAARLARSYVTVQVSSSAQGIIQARVDRLDAATRLTLKVAAVLGRSFSLRLLGIIHPARPAQETLREQLGILAALEIIDLELEDPERVYRFKYGITHEVAYTSLLFGQRRQLHAAVAAWYEQSYAAEIAAGRAAMAVFEVLIDHLGRAEEWARQAHYCRIAAEQAARQFATVVALRHIEQALIFTTEPAARLELLLLRVAVNDRVGNYLGQAEDLRELEALAPPEGSAQASRYALYFRLRYLLAMGLAPAVKVLAPQAIRGLRQAERETQGDARHELALLRAAFEESLAAARAATGARVGARELYQHTLNLCWAQSQWSGQAGPAAWLDGRSIAARALDGLGRLEIAAGALEEGIGCHRQALDVARTAGDWCAEARAREGLGRAYLAAGDPDKAMAEARAALTMSNAVGDRSGQAAALRLIGAVSAARGDYAAAERDAHYALAISAGARARALEARLWADVAEYAVAQGHAEAAVAARKEAERVRHQWQDEPQPARSALSIG
jgi:class 3 adenylate cyclase/tetratricopeptide (TPR) repeat protein